jgi:UDP-N-acetylmuramoyl-tripeptide--D-alanyl-D-alanine ligase
VITLKASEIARITGGVLHGDANIVVTGSVEVDSRKCGKGSLFLALKGENVDGHDFVTDASKHGALLSLTDRQISQPCIVVPDVIVALGKLAQHVREELSDLMVIGITGSQGKTTTKDLLKHILSVSGETIAPEESLNNELGVPLLILRCTETTKFCIVEMGARHSGDISYLAEIAKPHVGVVLTVGTAHLGEFGSRELIAKAKSELITSLTPGSTAILGTYDEFTPNMVVPEGVKRVLFGEKSKCEIRAADIEVREGRAHFDLVTPDGRAAVGLQLLGMHQISNALAAAASATALKIPIETISAALSTAEVSSKWRMEIFQVGEITLINDSYNANPESVAAALRTLALISQESGGVSWAILGKMQELGESSAAEHAAIGRLVCEIGIDNLVAVGIKDYLDDLDSMEDGGASAVHYFETKSDALAIVEHFAPGDVVLVKASRSGEFNLLVDSIREKIGEAEQ